MEHESWRHKGGWQTIQQSTEEDKGLNDDESGPEANCVGSGGGTGKAGPEGDHVGSRG